MTDQIEQVEVTEAPKAAGARIVLPTNDMVRTKSASGSVSFHCGDPVAKALNGASLELVKKLAADCGIDPSKYEHLNVGQQRMTIGNVLRNMLRREQISADLFTTLADQTQEQARAEKAAADAEKAALAEATKAEKAAAIEAAKAEKEAAKLAAKAERDAAKEAEKAEKAAAREAAKAEKEAAKLAKEAEKAALAEEKRLAAEAKKAEKEAAKAAKAEEKRLAAEAKKAEKEAAHPHADLVEEI